MLTQRIRIVDFILRLDFTDIAWLLPNKKKNRLGLVNMLLLLLLFSYLSLVSTFDNLFLPELSILRVGFATTGSGSLLTLWYLGCEPVR